MFVGSYMGSWWSGVCFGFLWFELGFSMNSLSTNRWDHVTDFFAAILFRLEKVTVYDNPVGLCPVSAV